MTRPIALCCAVVLLALSGCGGDEPPPADQPDETPAAPTAPEVGTPPPGQADPTRPSSAATPVPSAPPVPTPESFEPIDAMAVDDAGVATDNAPESVEAFFRAVRAGDTDAIRAGALLHPDWLFAATEQGRTPLHVATAIGQAAAVSTLVRVGADVNEPDDDGDTPMHLAARAGNTALARRLLMGEVDFTAVNDEGKTPLQLAREAGNDAMVRLLMSRGAVAPDD